MKRLLVLLLAACHTTPDPALPRAGSLDDDGTGALARVSRGQLPRADETPRVDASDPFGGDVYGGFGGDAYGGFSAAYPPYSPPPAATASSYVVLAPQSGPRGSIEGVVVWKGVRPPARLPASLRATLCPGAFENHTLRLGAGGGVGGSLVYLAGIKSGKAPSGGNGAPLPGVNLDVAGCRLAPHVLLARAIGALLRVVNQADTPVSVRLLRGGRGELVTVGGKNLELRLLDSDGVFEVAVESGHPAASAWVVVPAHPYFELSSDDGHFRLDDVPAGEHTLVVWHPPVATGVDPSGEVIRSLPFEVRRKIKVAAGGVTSLRIDLR